MKFTKLEYDEYKVLIEINDFSSFYPFEHNFRQLPNLPHYCEGITEIAGTINLVVDLASFLGFNFDAPDEEKLMIQITSDTGNIVLIIPTGEVLEYELDELVNAEEYGNREDIEIPASNYVLIENEINIVLFIESITKYLKNEISKALTRHWKKRDPHWELFPQLHQKPEESKQLTIKKSAVDITKGELRDNYFLCIIGGLKFAFKETNVIEIIGTEKISVDLPNSPEWVEGVIDYRGEDIPKLNIPKWLLLSESHSTDIESTLTVIINSENDFQYAIECDSITSIPKSKISNKQHSSSKLIRNIPFANILEIDDDYVYEINLEELGKSSRTKSIQQNWSSWKRYLENEKERILRRIEKEAEKELIGTGLLEFKYVELNYPDLNILLKLDDDHSIYQYDEIASPLEKLPEYCLGITELEGKVHIVVDLAQLFGIKPDPNWEKEELVLLRSGGDSGDIVYITPLPKVQSTSFEEKSMVIQPEGNLYQDIPAMDYVLFESGDIYMRIEGGVLGSFINDEIGEKLSLKWAVDEPYWGYSLKREFPKLEDSEIISPKKSGSTMAISSSKRQNIMVFQIGEMQFGFMESDVIELIYSDKTITEIPNSPEWVEGMIFYKNESIPLIDPSIWLEIEDRDFDRSNILIVKEHNQLFGIISSPTYSVAIGNPITIGDMAEQSLPFDKIIYESNYGWVYLINNDELFRSVRVLEKEYNWSDWRTFFKKTQAFEKEQRESDEISRDILYIEAENSSFAIPLSEIIEFRSIYDVQHHQLNGKKVTNLEKDWVPSISLNEIIKPEEQQKSPQMGVVVKRKDQNFEILGDRFLLSNIENEPLDKEKIRNLIGESNPLGISSLIKTDYGLAYSLNSEKLLEDELNKYDGDVQSDLQEINLPILQSKSYTQIEFITQLWDENVEKFVKISNPNEESDDLAINIKEIEEIHITHDSTKSIINWEYYDLNGNQPVYISLQSNEENLYEIPSDISFFTTEKEFIKTEDDSIYIEKEEERIRIISLDRKIETEISD